MEDGQEIREEAAALLIDYFPPCGRTEKVRQALELAITCGDKRSIKELLQLGLQQQQQTNQRTKVQLNGHREENELFILILAIALSFAAIAAGIAVYFYQKGVGCEVRGQSGSRADFVDSERGSSKRFYTEEKAIPRKFIRRN